MYRFLFPLALLCFLAAPAWSDDAAKDDKGPVATAAAKLKTETTKDNLNAYMQAALNEFFEVMQNDPDAAEKKLDEIKKFLDTLEPTEADAKTLLARAKGVIPSYAKRIDDARKLLTLVGKDAASLADARIEAWVNGTPLTDADLKGKVVFLDFWAVWCGPCIATFPHLKEWNEKYEGKGLVMIGLTRYYNYEWDDAAGRAKRINKDERMVSAEDEQKMLEKFAEQHELKHRFAVQGKESTLDDYYAVSGIPHVVVIDQEGKIRMIKVGSGDENAKALDGMLKELLEK
jgi:thiol-disulfide isomerase/thioredoxin